MNGRMEKEEQLSMQTIDVLMNLPEFVEEWYDHMEASDKAASTRLDFVRKIDKYFRSIRKDTNNIKEEDLTYRSIISYMNTIKIKINKDGEKVSTSGSYQRTVWAALNSFFKFMVKRKYIDVNPMDDIDISKKKDDVRINRNRKYLQINDFERIIEATSVQRDKLIRQRDKTILMIMMCTGIRRRALCQINIEDIDFSKKILTVIDKENAERDCILTDQVLKEIEKWIKIRKKRETTALFLSKRGNRISEVDVYNLVKKYSSAGLGVAISPHKIRAGFGTILYNDTKDIRYVQEVMGHSNVQTTQRYAVVDQNKAETIVSVFGTLK